MRDSMSGRGPGEDRHRTERLSRAPGEEWTPEQDSPDTDEWTPGDATPTHRTPRRPRPEERLPGEPGRAEAPRGDTGGWIAGTERTGSARGRIPDAGTGDGGPAADRPSDPTGSGPAGGRWPEASGPGSAGDRAPDAGGTGPAGGLMPEPRGTGPAGDTSGIGPAGGRLPGSAGPGREGLTGDDRTPEDTPAPPPGPAGTEGPRPGVEGAGYAQAPVGAEAGEGFADRPRAGREALTDDDRTPEDTPAPPRGPAGAGAGQWRGAEETGQWRGTEQAGARHGTEGLRPGTEELGAGFGASHRAEREAISEEHRMPDNGLGAPAPGEASRREAMTTDTPGRDTWPTAPGAPARDAPRSDTAPATGPVGTEPVAPAGAPATAQPAPSGHGSPLIAREEVEEWQRRMREVVGGFVDQPKGAVERADRTLEEIAARFSEAVTRRRRTLRMSWEGAEERGTGADTEQLRLALRDYRELAERLLHS
ncbi:hypothetical protein QWJ26_30655 [Streptomyces sp. CSDS2]|uniref:hypothetical protein n=1 Tax=Streptomyces sp. CSDS2 TaxID=3055051 RepID=UPI0025B20614|nr:hypothetical protein [Streptomyces sp. CSDS2]MDN3264099.1 hypothetical protein [Streptomyces sp. CSDS2]